MCGIIGIASNTNVSHDLLDALKVLEYRGYDSAGISVLEEKGQIKFCKSVGNVKTLEDKFKKNKIQGNIGIGHTRWATHGIPALENTHPFVISELSLAHNGIIENYAEIKKSLLNQGYDFQSDTDTEVILMLIKHYIDKGNNILQAILLVVKQLEGNYAFCLLDSSGKLTCVKNGSPLVLGITNSKKYIASDSIALSLFTDEIINIEDEEIVMMDAKEYKIINFQNQEIKKSSKKISIKYDVQKGQFQDYMLKEIYEQPEVLVKIANEYTATKIKNNFLNNINWQDLTGISIIACGTSYHAALISKYLFESIAQIPTEIELASEFRSRDIIFNQSKLYLFISQSGETIDTLVALKKAKKEGVRCISLVNVLESSIAKESDYVLPICAGIEIAVASTKAFTSQLFILSLLANFIKYEKNNKSSLYNSEKLDELKKSISQVQNIFSYLEEVKNVAQKINNAQKVIYIGRNINYPLALEGALKLKELTYIPALGIAAGELKHGSMALIDENTYIIVVAPNDKTLSKMISNIQEIHARKGKIILLTDVKNLDISVKNICHNIIKIPQYDTAIQPIAFSILLQLLAYYTTKLKGFNVDKPRNLAKSVTVE